MRRAVRMAAPCTDRGTIWLCFQVLIHFPRVGVRDRLYVSALTFEAPEN